MVPEQFFVFPSAEEEVLEPHHNQEKLSSIFFLDDPTKQESFMLLLDARYSLDELKKTLSSPIFVQTFTNLPVVPASSSIAAITFFVKLGKSVVLSKKKKLVEHTPIRARALDFTNFGLEEVAISIQSADQVVVYLKSLLQTFIVN